MSDQFITVERRLRGIEIHVKVDPMIEEIIKSSSSDSGNVQNPLDAYGRYWVPLGDKPIKVYPIDVPMDGTTYFLNNVGGALKDAKGRVNISFLQLAGISEGDGIKFLIAGPTNRDTVIEYGGQVRKAVEAFLRDYLDTVKIKINISLTQKG